MDIQTFFTLTEELGSLIVFTKAKAALVVDLMVSVLPSLNHLVPPLSYAAVGFPYSLQTSNTINIHNTHQIFFV